MEDSDRRAVLRIGAFDRALSRGFPSGNHRVASISIPAALKNHFRSTHRTHGFGYDRIEAFEFLAARTAADFLGTPAAPSRLVGIILGSCFFPGLDTLCRASAGRDLDFGRSKR